MLPASVYLDTVRAALARIEAVAGGHLDRSVEHCPGFDVAKLLEHTGGFCRIVSGRVARDEEWVPPSGTWQQAPEDEVAGDPIGWHRHWGNELLHALGEAVASEPVQTWAGLRTRYFWFRRAAQELSIHRWDAEHASASETPIADEVAIDGVDEFLGEFGERAAILFAGSGETFQFVAEPSGVSFTATFDGRALTTHSHAPPDVVARARADALVRFMWGRARPDELPRVEGDRSLIERWHDLVRI